VCTRAPDRNAEHFEVRAAQKCITAEKRTRGFPARAFLGSNALLRGAHFEVLGVAVRRPSAH